MRKCPCCGKFAGLPAESIVRRGVQICDKCEDLELDGEGEGKKEWSVDTSEASTTLRDYTSLQDRYFTARECSDDKVYVAKLERQYVKAKEQRAVKFVVTVESEDGLSPLAEFVDENLAKAKVFGWLGANYTPYGQNSWVSMYGGVISITEM
jgi:hypothetical protein